MPAGTLAHKFIECDECFKRVEYNLDQQRPDGWISLITDYSLPTYDAFGRGVDLFSYYCPKCAPGKREYWRGIHREQRLEREKTHGKGEDKYVLNARPFTILNGPPGPKAFLKR